MEMQKFILAMRVILSHCTNGPPALHLSRVLNVLNSKYLNVVKMITKITLIMILNRLW